MKHATLTGGGVFTWHLFNVLVKCVVNVLFMVHVASKQPYWSKPLLWENSALSWEQGMCDVQIYRDGLS